MSSLPFRLEVRIVVVELVRGNCRYFDRLVLDGCKLLDDGEREVNESVLSRDWIAHCHISARVIDGAGITS